MDAKTSDLSDAAKSRAVCVSPDGKWVVVGSKNGSVRVYKFTKNEYGVNMKLTKTFKHAK